MKGFSKLKKRYVILTMLFLAQILNFVDKTAINFAIIPITKELNLTSDKAGLVLSSFFLSYAIMQFIGGYLADKFGIKKVLTGAVFLWSFATILTGLVRSTPGLIVSRFLVGTGEGAFPASTSVAIVDNFKKQERARAKSVVSGGASIGFAIGSIVVTLMITSLGWKWMFILLGFLGIILALVLWLVLQPSEKKANNSVEKKNINKSLVKSSLKNPLVWKLMIAAFFTNITFWGLQSWLPSYWTKVKGMEMVTMGVYSSVPYILGLCSFLISGWILDKFMSGREKYMFIVGALLSALFIYLMFNTNSIPLAFSYLALSNIFLNAMNITVFVLPMKNIPESSVGTATGIINAGAQIGSIVTPSVLGYLISVFNQNYNVAFMFLVISSLIIFIIGFTINTKKENINTTPLIDSSK